MCTDRLHTDGNMPQELKNILIKASIDPATTPADLQEWDNQSTIIENTGIERDGGITNLYSIVEQNTMYEETYYTKTGAKVTLERDTINRCFNIYSDGVNVGKCPAWALKKRELVKLNCTDIAATVDGTFLVVTMNTVSGIPTVSEYDENFTLLRSQIVTHSIAQVSDAYIGRNKALSWSTLNSLAIVSLSQYVTPILLDGTALSTQSMSGNQSVFAYYERGWIVAKNGNTTSNIALYRSDGTLQAAAYYDKQFVTPNYDAGTDTLTFFSVSPIAASPTVMYKTYTPPVTLGGNWTITDTTDADIATPYAQKATIGGIS